MRGPVVARGEQGGFADGARGQLTVADGAGGVFVCPALGGVPHRGGDRAQQRVGGGGQLRHGDEEVVPAGEVGALVGQQNLPLPGIQSSEHAGRYHDASRPSWYRVGIGGLVVEDHQLLRDHGFSCIDGKRVWLARVAS